MATLSLPQQLNKSTTTATAVRLIPDIATKAHLLKLNKEIHLWLIIRSICTQVFNGYPNLDYEICKTICREHYGYSSRTFNRHLELGNGKFWSLSEKSHTNKATGEIITRSTIRFYGLYRVAEYLGITRITDKHYRQIQANQFNTLKKRNAQLFLAMHKPKGSRIIIKNGKLLKQAIKAHPRSRANLEAATGLSPRQQRRYCNPKYTGLRGRVRYGNKSKIPVNGHNTRPTTHRSQQTPDNQGMLGRLGKYLWSKHLISDEVKEVIVERVYFDNVKAYMKATDKAEISFIKTPWHQWRNPWVAEWEPKLCLI